MALHTQYPRVQRAGFQHAGRQRADGQRADGQRAGGQRTPADRLARIEHAVLTLARNSGHAGVLATGCDPFGDDDRDGVFNLFDTTPSAGPADSVPRRYRRTAGEIGGWQTERHRSGASHSEMTQLLMAMMIAELLRELRHSQARGRIEAQHRPRLRLRAASADRGDLARATQGAPDYDQLRREYRKLYAAFFSRLSSYAGLIAPRHTMVPRHAYAAEHYQALKAAYTLIYRQAEGIDRHGLRLLGVRHPRSV